MLQGATTAKQVEEAAVYVQSLLDQAEIFSYGAEPEMQVDFHIPCDEEHSHIAAALAAMIPCTSRQHQASAFKAGEYVQLSLHKEPSVELAEAFLKESLSRIRSDAKLAEQVARQIQKNQQAETARIQARMQRLQALKKNALN